MTKTIFGKKIVITRVWWHEGQEAGPDSAHRIERWGICRAADVRVLTGDTAYWTTEELVQIETFAQKGFPRLDGLPTIRIHGNPIHIHLQVEP